MEGSNDKITELEIEEVKDGSVTVPILERLKIQLRNDDDRESEVVTRNLPAIIDSFNKAIKTNLHENTEASEVLVGIYQVLVNLVARTDKNRDFFTTDSPEIHHFWRLTKSFLDKRDVSLQWLIFTFVGQFIVESLKVGNYMRFLHREGIHNLVYQDLVEGNDDAFDITYELIKANADAFDDSDNSLIEALKTKFAHYFQESDDTEAIEKLVEIVSYSGPDKNAFNEMLRRLSHVKDVPLARKMLVASTLLFTNKPTDVPIDQLTTANPYIFAVCCIVIGNCIENDATRDLTFGIVDADFGIDRLINTFFRKFKISDVIQIQAIHMWTNLMDAKIANEIVKLHLEKVISLNQVVSDNAQYYREIAALYYKFLRKLLMSTTEEVLTVFIRQINQFDGSFPDQTRVKYILLQKLNFDTEEAHDVLSLLMKSIVELVDQHDVLEQIKTISILNQHIASGKLILDLSILDKAYLPYLQGVLQQLHESKMSSASEGDVNSWQTKAFQNNLKFMAATTTKVLELRSNRTPSTDYSELRRICNVILIVG